VECFLLCLVFLFFLRWGDYSEVRPFHCQTLEVRHNWCEKERFDFSQPNLSNVWQRSGL